MNALKLPSKPAPNWEQVRDEWVRAVEQLVADVESWCRANNWPTRRITKHISEPEIGDYEVPALHLQFDLVQLLLEPVDRFVPGADGVVDLYAMPRYDDVASIFRRGGCWQVERLESGANDSKAQRDGSPPFTADEFTRIVKMMG